jgi:hypothetical protein
MDGIFDTRSRGDFSNRLGPADRLRLTTIPSRLRFTWFGAEKALTPEQKALAAQAFGAAGPCLTAAKRLLDARHPAFRALIAVRGKIEAYWRSISLPFPEPRVRLIPLDLVDGFARRMSDFAGEFGGAVSDLGRAYEELVADARARLGGLFDPSDYPPSLEGHFDLDWHFPGVAAPPGNLVWAWEWLHIMEEARIRANYARAVELAEAGFREQFARLLGDLRGRISGPDGRGPCKPFRDASVVRLLGFLERYLTFDVRSDGRLDELIDLAGQALQGITPQGLRHDAASRHMVAARLSWIEASLGATRDDAPREQCSAGPRAMPRDEGQ